MDTVELKALIEASKKDIDYCKKEIAKLAANAIEYPVNKGYAEKETRKLELIIDSHVRRLVQYVTELQVLEEATNEAEEQEAPTQQTEFKGKKYYTCRRCSGKGTYCDYGRCFGCNGYGKKKTKAYKVYLGEPTDDLPY